MSMKSPLVSIWRDDWAKRLSSRSSGGRLNMPGVHSSRNRSPSVAIGLRASHARTLPGRSDNDEDSAAAFIGAAARLVPPRPDKAKAAKVASRKTSVSWLRGTVYGARPAFARAQRFAGRLDAT